MDQIGDLSNLKKKYSSFTKTIKYQLSVIYLLTVQPLSLVIKLYFIILEQFS